jgi:hypothetical protein
MRLFQNSAIYPAYFPRLRQLDARCATFAEALRVFLDDRFGACHFLQPVLAGDPEAFFTNGHDRKLQHLWAKEQGLPRKASLREILYAQIEHHQTEVFYNLDPMRYQSDFVRGLPGCVKRAIAWRAAPSPGADFSAYDCVVSNFPEILKGYVAKGWKVGHLSPAVDPVMGEYAGASERTTDIVFAGGYSRHHAQRAEILESVAHDCGDYRLVYHLDCSRLTRLAESPLGALPPLRRYRRPASIRRFVSRPVFGRELYAAFAGAKIVLNGAIDMAGRERGNMRCFEAIGCGALLVTDEGRYPEGFVDQQTMCTYSSPRNAAAVMREILRYPVRARSIASRGTEVVRSLYSKEAQWRSFESLVGDI